MSTEKPFALILGGSKGLGLGSVRKLCREGYPVLVLHRDRRKDLPRIEEEFESIRNDGGILHSFHLDALKKDQREDFLSKIPSVLGKNRIGCVVFSLAKGNLKPLSKKAGAGLSGSDLRLTADAMAFALYDWMADLVGARLLSGDCRVIAFTSEGSSRAMPGYGAVASAKASLEALIRQMAVEWAPLGIRANCIQAGVTQTESLERIPESDILVERTRRRNPYGRLTTPADVGNAVYLLIRPEAAWITGNVLRVDGGESLC